MFEAQSWKFASILLLLQATDAQLLFRRIGAPPPPKRLLACASLFQELLTVMEGFEYQIIMEALWVILVPSETTQSQQDTKFGDCDTLGEQ